MGGLGNAQGSVMAIIEHGPRQPEPDGIKLHKVDVSYAMGWMLHLGTRYRQRRRPPRRLRYQFLQRRLNLEHQRAMDALNTLPYDLRRIAVDKRISDHSEYMPETIAKSAAKCVFDQTTG